MFPTSPSLRAVALAATAVLASLGAAHAGTTFEERLALADGGRFVLETAAGAVTVRGGSGDVVVVVVTSDRDDLRDKMEFRFESNGDEARVTARRKGAEGTFRRWFSSSGDLRVRFDVEVPAGVAVEVDTSGGPIEVSGVRGPVVADTSGGSIVLTGIGADVRADTSGGRIRVERIEGSAALDTSGGGIEAAAVAGSVDADTSGGSIALADVAGDVRADTSGGRITIENAGGRVEAGTSGGSIAVSFAPGNASGGTLETSGGGIDVRLDPAVSLSIDASTSGGSVRTDVPVTMSGSAERGRLRGAIGAGGATLRLRASGGGIRLSPI